MSKKKVLKLNIELVLTEYPGAEDRFAEIYDLLLQDEDGSHKGHLTDINDGLLPDAAQNKLYDPN